MSSENNHTTSIIKSFGYSITHFYTENCRGTGVAILFKNTLKVKPFSKFSSVFDSFQYRCVEISVKNQPSILLFVIYRCQEFTKDTFEQEFKHLLNFCDLTSYNILLVGDFNYHFEKTSDNTVIRLTNLISTYGLSPLIEVPTHRKGHTLDQIFVNTWELDVFIKEIVDINISDHFPIYFDVPLSSNTIAQPKSITYRNVREIE
jgi:endonuclease/exonuclease/phosphatase (EEP) superfamily protein YafD